MGDCDPNADPEAERPKDFEEAISGDQTWDQHGLRLKWSIPQVPGDFKIPVNENLRMRVCLESKQPIDDIDSISAWAWTNIVTKDNDCGVYKEIKLMHNPYCTMETPDGTYTYIFHNTIVPTKEDDYRLTFNIKRGSLLIWADTFQEDNICSVIECPRIETTKCVSPGVTFKCMQKQKKDNCGVCKPVKGGACGDQGGKKNKSENEDELEMLVMF